MTHSKGDRKTANTHFILAVVIRGWKGLLSLCHLVNITSDTTRVHPAAWEAGLVHLSCWRQIGLRQWRDVQWPLYTWSWAALFLKFWASHQPSLIDRKVCFHFTACPIYHQLTKDTFGVHPSENYASFNPLSCWFLVAEWCAAPTSTWSCTELSAVCQIRGI